jgi:hypothetical protein
VTARVADDAAKPVAQELERAAGAVEPVGMAIAP